MNAEWKEKAWEFSHAKHESVLSMDVFKVLLQHVCVGGGEEGGVGGSHVGIRGVG